MRSLKILEEFWATRWAIRLYLKILEALASRCPPRRSIKSFGRHGALPEDLVEVLGTSVIPEDPGKVLGVTALSLKNLQP